MRIRSVLVACVALFGSSPLSAQDVSEGPRAGCRLADEHMRADRFEQARDVATPAIDALRAQHGRRARRILGACLYTRGRAREALGDRWHAVSDYAESVNVRANDIVERRLRNLVPATPEASPLAALAIEESGRGEDEDAEIGVDRARSGDGTRWLLVSVAPGGSRNGSAAVFAIAEVCGAPHFVPLDSVAYDNATFLGVSGARARRIGDIDALVVRTEGGGDDNCQAMDGMADYEHRALAVVFVDECRLRVVRFRTDHDGCDGVHGISVRFGRDGRVITSRARGETPASAVGSFTLRELAR